MTPDPVCHLFFFVLSVESVPYARFRRRSLHSLSPGLPSPGVKLPYSSFSS